jgi:hypothetical protein
MVMTSYEVDSALLTQSVDLVDGALTIIVKQCVTNEWNP